MVMKIKFCLEIKATCSFLSELELMFVYFFLDNLLHVIMSI
jgi:hypothetical protein